MVNLGCLFSLEASPLSVTADIIRRFDVRRFIEFGMNNPAFNGIKDKLQTIDNNDMSASLEQQISKDIAVLDLSFTMKNKLRDVGLNTIKDVLSASENKLMEAYYVGEKRARMMKRVALTSVYEYLIG